MRLYKGYTKNDGKKPVDALKGVKQFRSFDEVQRFDSYGGVLSDNAILIDIDDAEQSEILMQMVEEFQLNCQVIQTSRGRHFTFINSGVTTCGTGKKLACGLTADIKVGGKNTVECLKIDGEERFVEWEFQDDESGVLPKWMHPVSSSVDFTQMHEGDGRDSALYGYILNLTSAGFSTEETRECIGIINRFVLPDPMSEDDIERITRDDAFPAETFYKGRTFLHNNFAVFLKNNDHIRRINGMLHVYRDGVYVPGSREIEQRMVKHLPEMKAAQRTEVLKYLDIICPHDTPVAEAHFIAFKNGILDIATGDLLPFSPDVVITNQIPWDYEPDAYSELADNTLNKISCQDPCIRSLLEEAVGYSFYRRNEMSKMFFLTGEGANGKSTFLDVLNHVVGDQNRSSLGLEELDERFSVATLANKLVNAGDDISDDFLQGKAISNLKKLVSGNEVKAEIKNDPNIFFMKPYTKFFFSANALPRTKSKGFAALMRRLVIIPFNARFTKDDPDYDPYITWKLRDEYVMKYMVRIGVEGLKRVLENNAFTESEAVQKEVAAYEMENNPILLWLQEKDDLDIANQLTKDVHKQYRVFCIENGFTELTLANFSKELAKRRGFSVKRIRVDGKLTSIYVKG
ncbi:MAG: phage/plasmid primase, P4 family [Bacteroidales bacterium]|nr:phage/plasmid primase, P4 family [Bacteroidales bacterium]